MIQDRKKTNITCFPLGYKDTTPTKNNIFSKAEDHFTQQFKRVQNNFMSYECSNKLANKIITFNAHKQVLNTVISMDQNLTVIVNCTFKQNHTDSACTHNWDSDGCHNFLNFVLS